MPVRSYSKHIGLYLVFITLFLFSCSSSKKLNYILTEKKHEPEQLKKEADYVYKMLTLGHPGVYWYIDKTSFEAKFDSLKASLNQPLTSKEFYRKIAPFVEAIHCGHTRLILNTRKYSKKEKDSLNKLTKPINQFSYRVIENRLFVNSVNKNISQAKRGNEIIAINGVPSSILIPYIKTFFASDGYNQTFKTALLNRTFATWYTNVYENKDSLNFKIKKQDTLIDLAVKTLKKEEVKNIKTKEKQIAKVNKDSLLQQKVIAKENRKLKYKGLDENKKPLLDLQFLTKDSTVAYLKVKSFSFPNADFTRFYRETFSSIKLTGAKDLIIDLRNNGGGSLRASRNLFSYLVDKDFIFLKPGKIQRRYNVYWHSKGIGNAIFGLSFELANLFIAEKKEGSFYVNFKGIKPLPAKKDNFKGNIYVLINGYSFSASALLAANLKQLKRATFVGQETGGAYNGCVAGYLPIFQLPYSKLKFRMGLYPVLPNAETDVKGRGIFPDYPIELTIEDYFQNKDKELEWVLNDIKKKG